MNIQHITKGIVDKPVIGSLSVAMDGSHSHKRKQRINIRRVLDHADAIIADVVTESCGDGYYNNRNYSYYDDLFSNLSSDDGEIPHDTSAKLVCPTCFSVSYKRSPSSPYINELRPFTSTYSNNCKNRYGHPSASSQSVPLQGIPPTVQERGGDYPMYSTTNYPTDTKWWAGDTKSLSRAVTPLGILKEGISSALCSTALGIRRRPQSSFPVSECEKRREGPPFPKTSSSKISHTKQCCDAATSPTRPNNRDHPPASSDKKHLTFALSRSQHTDFLGDHTHASSPRLAAPTVAMQCGRQIGKSNSSPCRVPVNNDGTYLAEEYMGDHPNLPHFSPFTPRGQHVFNPARLNHANRRGPPRWTLENFDISRKLGQGRFGKIYLAREKESKCAVAIKCISKDIVAKFDLEAQIQREVQLHVSLHTMESIEDDVGTVIRLIESLRRSTGNDDYIPHYIQPQQITIATHHLLRVLAYFWDDQTIYLVEEYCDGGDLGRYCSEQEKVPILVTQCSDERDSNETHSKCSASRPHQKIHDVVSCRTSILGNLSSIENTTACVEQDTSVSSSISKRYEEYSKKELSHMYGMGDQHKDPDNSKKPIIAQAGNIIVRQVVSEDNAREIIGSICVALDHLHNVRRIIHRDLKTENILLKRKRELRRRSDNSPSTSFPYDVKVADFTWAVQLPQGPQQGPVPPKDRRNTLCGTLDFLSPELIKQQPYDFSVDMWSVGVIAFQLLFGYLPFEDSTPQETCLRIVKRQIKEFPELRHNCRVEAQHNILTGRNDLPHVSSDAKEFILSLLQLEADDRLTARSSLDHRWISDTESVMKYKSAKGTTNSHLSSVPAPITSLTSHSALSEQRNVQNNYQVESLSAIAADSFQKRNLMNKGLENTMTQCFYHQSLSDHSNRKQSEIFTVTASDSDTTVNRGSSPFVGGLTTGSVPHSSGTTGTGISTLVNDDFSMTLPPVRSVFAGVSGSCDVSAINASYQQGGGLGGMLQYLDPHPEVHRALNMNDMSTIHGSPKHHTTDDTLTEGVLHEDIHTTNQPCIPQLEGNNLNEIETNGVPSQIASSNIIGAPAIVTHDILTTTNNRVIDTSDMYPLREKVISDRKAATPGDLVGDAGSSSSSRAPSTLSYCSYQSD